MTEAGKGTVVHGIATGSVSNPGQDVLIPIQVASLQRRLEPGENRDIVFQGILLSAAVVPIVRIVRHRTAATLGHLRRQAIADSLTSPSGTHYRSGKVHTTLTLSMIFKCQVMN